MAKKKKTKKRDVTTFPGLDKRLFSKIKQEYHDIDYADQLSDSEKKWLSQFMEEHLGANLDETRHKKRYNRKNLHKTKTHRKDCFDRNNARQRDIYSLSKATGKLDNYQSENVMDYLDSLSGQENPEEQIIEKLDSEKLPQDPHLLESKKNGS